MGQALLKREASTTENMGYKLNDQYRASAEKVAAMVPPYMHAFAVTPLLWSAVETCMRRKQEGIIDVEDQLRASCSDFDALKDELMCDTQAVIQEQCRTVPRRAYSIFLQESLIAPRIAKEIRCRRKSKAGRLLEDEC